jgi:hypothetical protein
MAVTARRRRVLWIAAVTVLVIAGITAFFLRSDDASETGSAHRPTRSLSAGGLTSEIPEGWKYQPGNDRFETWLVGRSTDEEDGSCDQRSDRMLINLTVESGALPRYGKPIQLPAHVGPSTAPIRTHIDSIDCMDTHVQGFNVDIAGQPYRLSLVFGPEANEARLAEAYAIIERLRPA